MKSQKKSALLELLDEITPEEQEKTDIKMLLASKISDAMQAKGWNNTALLNALGKSNPSEITRWLSGTHNFTTDTLIDLQRVLDVRLLDVSTEVRSDVSYYYTVKTNSEWAHFKGKTAGPKKNLQNQNFELQYT